MIENIDITGGISVEGGWEHEHVLSEKAVIYNCVADGYICLGGVLSSLTIMKG